MDGYTKLKRKNNKNKKINTLNPNNGLNMRATDKCSNRGAKGEKKICVARCRWCSLLMLLICRVQYDLKYA